MSNARMRYTYVFSYWLWEHAYLSKSQDGFEQQQLTIYSWGKPFAKFFSVGFCLAKFPPKVLPATFAQSQWSVTNGCLDTGVKLTLSQAVTLNQDHLAAIAFFGVSSQTLASSIRWYIWWYYNQNLPLHCQEKTYFILLWERVNFTQRLS